MRSVRWYLRRRSLLGLPLPAISGGVDEAGSGASGAEASGGAGFEQPSGGGFGGESLGMGGGMGGFGSSPAGTDTGGTGLGMGAGPMGGNIQASPGPAVTSTAEPVNTIAADTPVSNAPTASPLTSHDLIDSLSGDPQGTLSQTMADLPQSVSYGGLNVVNGTVQSYPTTTLQKALLGAFATIPVIGTFAALASRIGATTSPTDPGPTEPGTAALDAIGGGGGSGIDMELGSSSINTSGLSGTNAAGGLFGSDPTDSAAGAGGTSDPGPAGTVGPAFGAGLSGGGLGDLLNQLASLFAPQPQTPPPAGTGDSVGTGGGTVDMGGGGVTYLPTTGTVRSPLALLVVLAGLALVAYYVYQRQKHKRGAGAAAPKEGEKAE